MFANQDKHFEQTAADPVRRRQAISRLSWRRDLMFWCAVGTTLCALATFYLSLQRERGGAAAAGFVAAVQWMLLFKFESDLRLLRVIEGLRLCECGKTSV
jgi:hypothetical protein